MSVPLPWTIQLPAQVVVTKLERTPSGQTHVEATFDDVEFIEFWVNQEANEAGSDDGRWVLLSERGYVT